jgi:hypothetical protein
MSSTTAGTREVAHSHFPVLLTTSLVSSLIMLDSNIVAISLPTIGRSLVASFTDMGPSIDWGIMNRAIRSVGYIAGWGVVDGMDATFGWDRG